MALAPPRYVLSGAPRDPAGDWLVLRIASLATIAISAISVGANLFELLAPMAFERALESPILLEAYYYLGGAYSVTFLLMFAALLWLTYRLARNLHALSPTTFSMSPTYAMAWYIVPVANFFMPPRVVATIARETHAAAGNHETRTATAWWWAAFIIGALLSNVSSIVAAGAYDPAQSFDEAEYESALWISVIASAIAINAMVLTIRIFGPIAHVQTRMIAERNRKQP